MVVQALRLSQLQQSVGGGCGELIAPQAWLALSWKLWFLDMCSPVLLHGMAGERGREQRKEIPCYLLWPYLLVRNHHFRLTAFNSIESLSVTHTQQVGIIKGANTKRLVCWRLPPIIFSLGWWLINPSLKVWFCSLLQQSHVTIFCNKKDYVYINGRVSFALF